ncbi:acetate/propionate family kinase [Xanthobacter agilis]|jgi:acetate kinase|uniref:Acetate kinase n=1 Tax=Xanthobacter agilis TaxID=47492 RepID=A0ABU0LHV0_XANAG|nr:acetate/propionate family kinase [Xanthobacter agilis]MDQ0506710.1 acetate kinase [Xanthobacter agilis]
MTDAVLVVNSGSTSLKFGAYTTGKEATLLCRGVVDSMSTDPHFVAKEPDGKPLDAHEWGEGQVLHHKAALNYIIGWLEQHEANIKVVAAGHRVVLGGTRFDGPVVITPEVLDYLDGLSVMEPSHQAFNVRGARAIAEDFPGLPQVAVFDSSFHRTMPDVAQIYPLPKAARDTGVRHWGYHGISYDYISRQVPKVAPEARRVIVGHLGGGASVCAMLDGKSIETSMAFAGLTGLPMATRSGDVPADVIFYLLRTKAYTSETLEKALYGDSGLLGLSGTSSDMRVLQASPDADAKLAVDYFVYALVKFIGAYTALLGGLDALVFTAGIGENSAIVRAAVLERLDWLGLKLDAAANAANGPRISTADSKVAAFVIPTNEELMIAQHTLDLVSSV